MFAEHLICMAEQAWPDQNLTSPLIEAQLIDCFIDGLTDGGIARKVMRENSATLIGSCSSDSHIQTEPDL